MVSVSVKLLALTQTLPLIQSYPYPYTPNHTPTPNLTLNQVDEFPGEDVTRATFDAPSHKLRCRSPPAHR